MQNNYSSFQYDKPHWYNPVQISPETLYLVSSDKKNIKKVLSALKNITRDDYLDYMIQYYQNGLAKFGKYWKYSDLLTLLHASAKLLKPENYLEIGVRRGRSLAVASAAYRNINIYGFDLWMANYAGMENPGPDFVAGELKKIRHKGKLELVSGDSRETIPHFLAKNTELYFDIITVDGDHSEEGAQIDLLNVIPRLKVGGVLLLDDITHPQHEYLEKVWDEIIGNNKKFTSRKYTELGYGIAFAIRRCF